MRAVPRRSFPGEGLPNEALWAAGVRQLADLPFIDADGIAVTTAETLARGRKLGLWSAGTTGYHTRRAPTEEVDRLRRLFAPAIAVDELTPPQGSSPQGQRISAPGR